MSDFLNWIENSSGTAAWVQALGAIVALFSGFFVPWIFDRRSLRHALRWQVRIMASQYVQEFERWQTVEFEMHPRAPRLPPLTVLDANADKLGLLSNNEIVAFVSLSGKLYELSALVSGRTDHQLREVRPDIQLLLKAICYHAWECLQPLPGSQADLIDKNLSEALHRVGNPRNAV